MNAPADDINGWHERVAIVTGGSKGIGRAVVERIIADGGRVATVARNGDQLKNLADAGVVVVRGDLTNEGLAEELVSAALESFGRLDALINNVGRGDLTPWDTSDDSWREMLEINLLTAVRMCRVSVPELRRSSSARIVNIGTELVYMPDQDLVPYTAAKAALLTFSKSLASALASDGVLVNVVVPGTVATEGVLGHYQRQAESRGRTLERELNEFIELRRRIPLGRLARPEEIAEVVAFAASARLTFATGAVFRCDGGSTPSPM